VQVTPRLILAFSLLLSGCASAAQEVSFRSTPPGATVTIGTIEVKTPATIFLSLNSDYVARYELEGYEPVAVTLEREFTWVEEATYYHDHWYGRLPMTRTELDIFLLPYRLLVGTAWRFYPEVGVSLVPQDAKTIKAAEPEPR
jgi:hypothetical protein